MIGLLGGLGGLAATGKISLKNLSPLAGFGGMAASGMIDEETLKKMGLLGGLGGGAASGMINPRQFGIFGSPMGYMGTMR